jgi:dTDP-4-amino-4,6-dideoxygalactose transaminase
MRSSGSLQATCHSTEALAAEVLSLPLYPELPEASLDRVAAELNALVG